MNGEQSRVEILTHPSPALRQDALDVDPRTDGQLKRLVELMARTMYDAPGVGLAATQVGVLKRVIVFDVDEELVAMCNPVITEHSHETEVEEEGCLSLPGISVPIERPVSISCEGVDLDGNPIRIEGEDLLARVLQHEIDHLDGVLIIDRATPEEKKEALKRYREAVETAQR